MLKSLMVFKNIEVFKGYFKDLASQDIRAAVVKRGWHHFNMQSIVFIAGLSVFSSLGMTEIVTYMGFGFLSIGLFIYLNTQRNIKFSEQTNEW